MNNAISVSLKRQLSWDQHCLIIPRNPSSVSLFVIAVMRKVTWIKLNCHLKKASTSAHNDFSFSSAQKQSSKTVIKSYSLLRSMPCFRAGQVFFKIIRYWSSSWYTHTHTQLFLLHKRHDTTYFALMYVHLILRKKTVFLKYQK